MVVDIWLPVFFREEERARAAMSVIWSVATMLCVDGQRTSNRAAWEDTH
jgi:hypothetical protein